MSLWRQIVDCGSFILVLLAFTALLFVGSAMQGPIP